MLATESPQVEFRAAARVPELDGFRGLAILLVVAGHAVDPSSGTPFGHLGVLLFFVLSGYLITGLLFREYEATGRIDLRAFYLRRARRLFPALACFLAGAVVLNAAGVIPRISAKEFAVSIFYVRNIFGTSPYLGHLWSLSLEEQFYTLWPLLFCWLGSRRMLRAALWIGLLVMLARGVAIATHPQLEEMGITYERPWFRFDSLAAGCILALLPTPRSRSALYLLAAPILVVWSYYSAELPAPVFLSVQTILAATFLLSVIEGGPIVKRIFSAPWLRWLGLISYSLYLWQQFFFFPLNGRFDLLTRLPVNIGCALLLASLSRRYVELPFLNRRTEQTVMGD